MSSVYNSDSQRPQERQPTVRSRANITSACLACKRRKRKCQGGNPCPHCAALKIECCYDERLDKRRKAFNDKARAETDFQRRVLDGLLRAIKNENAEPILEMVRADASLAEIAERLDTLDAQRHSHPSTAQHTHARDLLPVPSVLQRSQSSIYDPPYSPTRSSTSRVLDIEELLQPQPQPQLEPSLSPSDHDDFQLPPLNMIHQPSSPHDLQSNVVHQMSTMVKSLPFAHTHNNVLHHMDVIPRDSALQNPNDLHHPMNYRRRSLTDRRRQGVNPLQGPTNLVKGRTC